MRTFVVSVYGFSEESVEAVTRNKAMYKAFCAFREAGYRWDFHKFLVNTRVWVAGR
ncbi:hypothetical protein [Sinorhizobium medicae]|uniref:hypothetical protein n=1 Tax=Sinorhizobium medicae TaxID=110321 RepID=UPI0013E2D524|nr:hypothetical protein [Sinorhizobium medicae]